MIAQKKTNIVYYILSKRNREMKSYNLIGGGILILIASAVVTEVDSFIVHQTCAIIMTTRLSYLQRTTSTKPLFLLHIDELHPHRDSITRLDDPIPEVAEKKYISNDKKLHIFTHHIAPIVLGKTYCI